jgi:hypothetical protein
MTTQKYLNNSYKQDPNYNNYKPNTFFSLTLLFPDDDQCASNLQNNLHILPIIQKMAML